MLQIEIDGKELAVEQGKTVIEAAHSAGVYIPHFCYHKKLSIAASCRMCLVEVEKMPKAVPACATPVTDGMKVSTCSQKTKEAQKGVMEFLLINHPLDCPICDQGGECQLQDLAVGYGKGIGKFSESKNTFVGKDMGALISAEEMSRCIRCTRCIRFVEEIAGYQEIGMANRGDRAEILPFVGKTVDSEISGNVIDLCPVGALTSKPFRYTARSWELSRRKSISGHDALGSNLIVQTKDHRVRRVLPLENEAINECWLSDRDRFAYEGLNHPDRLGVPMIKQNNTWHEVDWVTAFEYVAKGLKGVAKDHGKDAIAMWVNPSNTVEELYLSKKLAQNFGIAHLESRLRQQDSRLDEVKSGAFWLGQDIEAFGQSDVFLIIGAQLRAEQPLLTARIRKAAQKGAKVCVVNAAREVLHMPNVLQHIVHPNCWLDDLSALSREENGVLGQIADCLKNGEKISVVLGAEAQNHPDFANIYAVSQQLAQSLGAAFGILPQTANSVAADLLKIRPDNASQTWNEMIEHPKKAVMLVNVEPDVDVQNPVSAMKALEEAETVIAATAYRSEALMNIADVLLPITPFTETSGSFINMAGSLQSFYGVSRPHKEARPLWKVLRVLGNTLDLEGFDFNHSQEVLAEAVTDDVKSHLHNLVNFKVQKAGFDSKVDDLTRVGGICIYETDAIVRRAASLQKTVWAKEPSAKVHSKTLEALGLEDASLAEASQREGVSVTVRLQADDTLPENVVFLPWHRSNAQLGASMSKITLKRG